MNALPFDVAIIGAGPIGIELAVACQRSGIRHVHFEAGQIGATIQWWAPGTRWFSSNDRIAIAGLPLTTPDQSKSTRESYLAYLRAAVVQFDLPIRTYEPVVGVEATRDGFAITSRATTGIQITHARRIVLATGGTDRPRLLDIPGESLSHVSAYFSDPHIYFRKRVLIVGGKNGAVEAALRCHHAGAQVILSYRKPELPEKSIKYWLMPEIKGLLRSGAIQGHFQTTPTEITPSHVTLRHLTTHEQINIPADFVLKQIGYVQDDKLFHACGITLTSPDRSPTFDEQTMETNVKGIHVAGTAVGGTQDSYRIFLENCHVHVDRIIAHLTGQRARIDAPHLIEPET